MRTREWEVSPPPKSTSRPASGSWSRSAAGSSDSAGSGAVAPSPLPPPRAATSNRSNIRDIRTAQSQTCTKGPEIIHALTGGGGEHQPAGSTRDDLTRVLVDAYDSLITIRSPSPLTYSKSPHRDGSVSFSRCQPGGSSLGGARACKNTTVIRSACENHKRLGMVRALRSFAWSIA
jgi:hypothetical protein